MTGLELRETWRTAAVIQHRLATAALAITALAAITGPAPAQVPPDFVYLADVAPSVKQDMRYAGMHNFVGRPIAGYEAAECVLTASAAQALAAVQGELLRSNLSLVVWDCYRPTSATADFVAWSKIPGDQRMKAEFYPRTDKSQFFALGYVSAKSAHSRGSTVDVGVMPVSSGVPPFNPAERLQPCIAPKGLRFEDGTLDFGTGYDCFDVMSAPRNRRVGTEARANRAMLGSVMARAGFRPNPDEWWHFTLRSEPFPARSFDFPVTPHRRP
jgi:D-alanyl-D-alanine dipeptidase